MTLKVGTLLTHFYTSYFVAFIFFKIYLITEMHQWYLNVIFPVYLSFFKNILEE